jgi:hypothetical protein
MDEASGTRPLLTVFLVFILLIVGWFVLLVGGAACDENPRNAELCRFVDGNGPLAPTIWVDIGAVVILATTGLVARRTQTIVLTALALVLLQLTIIAVTLIVAV